MYNRKWHTVNGILVGYKSKNFDNSVLEHTSQQNAGEREREGGRERLSKTDQKRMKPTSKKIREGKRKLNPKKRRTAVQMTLFSTCFWIKLPLPLSAERE